MENAYFFATPIGLLTVFENGAALTALSFGRETLADSQPTPLLLEAEQQINAYFARRLQDFTLPLAPAGTPFQQRVWQALLQIPYGETRSYRQIAEAAGSPRGFRAVGMANHANPLPILIPCHRVIAADGTLGGYSSGLVRKMQLLACEAPGLSLVETRRSK